ncbi:Hypothetical_protein [Hexamita inflata]|uniref:Hypothetical_protein n=1 Tax=Hexamita inflata TaxID=28002 RepID=A0AA86NY87_9EUKA|nr:Hypothetical protein HINF_LOCUS14990 [Hexamita inflata]
MQLTKNNTSVLDFAYKTDSPAINQLIQNINIFVQSRTLPAFQSKFEELLILATKAQEDHEYDVSNQSNMLNSQLNDKIQTITKLQQEMYNLAQCIKQRDQRIQELHNGVRQAEDLLLQSESRCKSLDQFTTNQQKKIYQLEQQNVDDTNQKSQQIKQLSEDLAQTQQQLSILQIKFQKIEEDNKQLQIIKEQSHDKLTEQENSLHNNFTSQFEQIANQLSDAQKQIQNHFVIDSLQKTKILQLEYDNTFLNEQLQQHIQLVKNKQSSRMDASQLETADENDNEFEKQQKLVHDLTKRNEILAKELHKQSLTTDETQIQLKLAQNKLTDAEEVIKQLTQERWAIESQLKQTQNQLFSITNQAGEFDQNAIIQERNQLKAAVDVLRQELKMSKIKIQSLKNGFNCSDDMDAVKEELLRLNKIIIDQNGKIKQLQNQIAQESIEIFQGMNEVKMISKKNRSIPIMKQIIK